MVNDDVVQSADDARALALAPLLVLDSVEEFFDAESLGRGPIRWKRIGDGQSNVTYLIERDNAQFVLRRGPRPPHPRSAHDMIREARIQQAVRAQGVPVPEILAMCDDDSVLGVPFYVMEYKIGDIITNHIPPALSSMRERHRTSVALVDALISLHQLDVSSGELATFGRPAGYLRRQVETFDALWDVNTKRELPIVHEIGEWLTRNLPASQRAAIVHGDFRMGNLMFANSRPARVVAILDWEMAALGDPLADLGYLTATYAESGSDVTPMELTSVTREPGYFSRSEIIEHYRAAFDLDLDALPWYQTLALWKAAIFCEAIYSRWLNGERPDDNSFGPSLESGVRKLLDLASQVAKS